MPAGIVKSVPRLDVPVSAHQSKDLFGGDTSCSFRMSTPTTQAAGTPAASAVANAVVATSATTGSSLASTTVVTPTVTTPMSPKRTMSLGDYKKTRGNALFARDELEALFDAGSDADIEDEEEEDERISSSTRVDPSVASRRPREGDSDASSSKRSRSGCNRPLADAGLLSSPRSGADSISSGTVVSRTGPVRDPWMPTPSEIQSRFGSTAPPSQYALYSFNGIVDDDVTKELDFDQATDQRRDYCIGLFHELRWSRLSSTPFGDFVGGGLRTPSPFPERPASGRSAAPTYHGSKEILSNEYENDQDLGSGSDDQQFAERPSELSPVRLAVGVEVTGRRRESGPPDPVDRLEAIERLQTGVFAALRQELALLKAQLAQVSQTASNVQVDLGSKLAVLRTRVGALEQASAPSHQD
ncbi:unnamed protein product [Phytophthora fragariaefolia]|uniref:Unnamed protein product n=1 Tax=Phytophthora fragariaefolia TaxID=1490495 RepID=A0A9W6XQF1_9STRA|nr:unnamed protein product [Phytophthora fragariaefolia]